MKICRGKRLGKDILGQIATAFIYDISFRSNGRVSMRSSVLPQPPLTRASSVQRARSCWSAPWTRRSSTTDRSSPFTSLFTTTPRSRLRPSGWDNYQISFVWWRACSWTWHNCCICFLKNTVLSRSPSKQKPAFSLFQASRFCNIHVKMWLFQPTGIHAVTSPGIQSRSRTLKLPPVVVVIFLPSREQRAALFEFEYYTRK